MRKALLFIFILSFSFSLATIPIHADEITLSSGDVVMNHEVNSDPADWSVEDHVKASKASSPPPPKVNKAYPVNIQGMPIEGPPVSWPANNPGEDPVSSLDSSEIFGMAEQCPASAFSWGWVGDYNEFPFRVIGKLRFYKDGSYSWQCSAALINPKLVITAAHCVANGVGGLYAGPIFAPAYKDGNAPYGWYGVKTLWLFKSYYYGGNPARDVAVLILNDPIGSYLGYLGLTANTVPNQTWSQIGYPGETGPGGEPFDGTDQVWNRSPLGYRLNTGSDPYQIAAGSCLTQGSSGGPWIIWENMWVNGVVSLGTVLGCPYTFTTPYFDYSVWEMVLAARDAQ
jgi:hypothetical protein